VKYEEGPKFFQVTDESISTDPHNVDVLFSPVMKDRTFYQFRFKSLELYRHYKEITKGWGSVEFQLLADTGDGEEFTVDNLYDSKEIIPAYVKNQVEEVSVQVPLIERGIGYVEEALKESGEQTL